MVRHHENDDLLLRGWAKFFHNIFLFVTFPLRRPVKFVLIMLFLLGLAHIPVITHQVKKEDLFDWYKDRIMPVWQSVSDGFAEFKKEYFAEKPEKKSVKKTAKSARNKQKLQKNSGVERYAKRYDKQAEKEKMASYSGDEADRQYQYSVEEYENSAIRNTGRKNPYYGTVSKFDLSYPEEILEISGTADIVNANELVINGVHMFLFGVYTDPNSENYEYAIRYLKEETNGKGVRCEILAYSGQGIATSVCYIGVKSINDALVSMGMAKKVL